MTMDNDHVSDSITAVRKHELALRLLEAGGLLVTFDATEKDVFVPFRYKHRAQLTLPVGRWRQDREDAVHVGDAGITGTLRFNRMAWPCRLPWRSVVALASMEGHGTFWRGEALADPSHGKGVEIVPIAEHFHHYLVVNGEAIVGKGESILVIEGRELAGIKWIDWNGGRARIGGDMRDLFQHLGVSPNAKNRRLRFSAALGYVTGKQRSQVQWDLCRLISLSEQVAEFRTGNYHEMHFGVLGPMPYLREWLFRLRAYFSKNW
jgi:hypothetical protein